jgi:hypothetical protein
MLSTPIKETMIPSSRDRVGIYTATVMFAAMGLQVLEHGRDSKFDLPILLAIVGSLMPFCSTFAASWRGEMSKKRSTQVPWMMGISVIFSGLIGAFFSEFRGFEPRTGAVLALVGTLNLVIFRMVAGGGALVRPSFWSLVSLGTGICVGFMAAVIAYDIPLILAACVLYGIYGFTNHWMIRSIIDEPATQT